MNTLRFRLLIAAACLVAAAVTIGCTSAAPLNCAVNPYCPQDIVVPPSQVDASTGAPSPGATYEILIDIDEPLPFSITFPTSHGGLITIVQRIATHTADADVSLATTDGNSAPVLAATSRLPGAPRGFTVVAQYRTMRSGDGTITITHTVQEPGAKPYRETIPIHVR